MIESVSRKLRLIRRQFRCYVAGLPFDRALVLRVLLEIQAYLIAIDADRLEKIPFETKDIQLWVAVFERGSPYDRIVAGRSLIYRGWAIALGWIRYVFGSTAPLSPLPKRPPELGIVAPNEDDIRLIEKFDRQESDTDLLDPAEESVEQLKRRHDMHHIREMASKGVVSYGHLPLERDHSDRVKCFMTEQFGDKPVDEL